MNEASSRDESRAADDIPTCGRMAREIRRPSVPVCFFEATKDILLRTQKKKETKKKGRDGEQKRTNKTRNNGRFHKGTDDD